MSIQSKIVGMIMILLLGVMVLKADDAPATQPTTAPVIQKPMPQPWHFADIWWNFAATTPHFQSLDEDVTIDRDVPSTCNLYVSPCGLGELNGIQFYGGLQTNSSGWTSATDQTRFFIGKGGIFSRWGKGNLSITQARGADDSRFEAAGYEGDFVSVRRPFAWTKGTYTYSLRAADNETVDGKDFTWISCFITAHDTGLSRFIGSLRFEGKDLTFWKRHSAFVEVYSTDQIPTSDVPDVKVTFGYPRINGQPPVFKSANVFHPGPGDSSGAPPFAIVTADGANVVVALGPDIKRTTKEKRHSLAIVAPTTQP